MNTKSNTLNSGAVENRKKNNNIKIANYKNNFRLKKLLTDHKYAYFDSIKNLYSAPISNLLTISVLGFTLALPILLYIIFFNINTSLNLWQNNLYQYSIYLDNSYTNSKIEEITKAIDNWPQVENTQIITKTQGLAELKAIMGLEDVLDNIENNPLPTVLLVSLKHQFQNIDELKNLIEKTKQITNQAKVEADIFWLEKISSLLNLAFQIIYIFSAALALAVLLVIGNTIRLNIQSKITEMKIYSMLGATHSYIRRPYLYDGAIYGLFTAVIALAIAKLLYARLNTLITDLGYSELFNHNLLFISNSHSIKLLLISASLGWIGARFTLYWQIKNLDNKLDKLY